MVFTYIPVNQQPVITESGGEIYKQSFPLVLTLNPAKYKRSLKLVNNAFIVAQ